MTLFDNSKIVLENGISLSFNKLISSPHYGVNRWSWTHSERLDQCQRCFRWNKGSICLFRGCEMLTTEDIKVYREEERRRNSTATYTVLTVSIDPEVRKWRQRRELSFKKEKLIIEQAQQGRRLPENHAATESQLFERLNLNFFAGSIFLW